MENLEKELKELIVTTLNLEHVRPEAIQTENALFGDGLGLDSIDALELGVAIKKKYRVTLNVDDGDVKKHFYSVKSLAEFIQNSQA
ncbi:MAG TPA: phosphopantetheine-binding protein [Bdellovibrionota bacterium]|jgi:acyl carrier protein|nr:phosphopantetheine-binding protein [Bdellovibrionota bacterium]